jgi:hypothetical protein
MSEAMFIKGADEITDKTHLTAFKRGRVRRRKRKFRFLFLYCM